MGSYKPLRVYLEAHGRDYVPMTFAEIEKVLGRSLPDSKQYPAWWSNNPSNNPMTKEWLAAGYRTESVNIGGEKLVFRRAEKLRVEPSRGGAGSLSGKADSSSLPRHPLFGCMKGTLTLDPNLDLTAPADPDLADYLDKKYGGR